MTGTACGLLTALRACDIVTGHPFGLTEPAAALPAEVRAEAGWA